MDILELYGKTFESRIYPYIYIYIYIYSTPENDKRQWLLQVLQVADFLHGLQLA